MSLSACTDVLRRSLPWACLLVASPAWSESHLIPFELRDQFDRVHTDSDVRGQPVVLFGSDREGSRYSGSWGVALSTALKEHENYPELAFLSVPNLTGAPTVLRSWIKRKFSRDPDRWSLMDWEGEFARAYGFAPGLCNILVFDRDGRLVHRVAVGPLEDSQLERLLETLEEVMPS